MKDLCLHYLFRLEEGLKVGCHSGTRLCLFFHIVIGLRSCHRMAHLLGQCSRGDGCSFIRPLKRDHALPQSRPVQISGQVGLQLFAHGNDSLRDHGFVHQLTGSTDEEGRHCQNASSHGNDRPFVRKHRPQDIKVGVGHPVQLRIPHQFYMATSRCFVPESPGDVQILRVVDTIAELPDCEVARSPTSLTTCCDDQQQQVVSKFRKLHDVHRLIRIVCQPDIFRPYFLRLVAVDEGLKIFNHQLLLLIPLLNVGRSQVECIRQCLGPQVQPVHCRIDLEQQQK